MKPDNQADNPVTRIKETLKIEDIVGETFTIVGKGNRRTTKEHESLTLYLDSNTWYWFSRTTGGDLFDWWQMQHRCSFPTAIEELAAKAHVELRSLSPQEREVIATQRLARHQRNEVFAIAAAHYNTILRLHPDAEAARQYCYGRGWTDATIETYQLGYVLPPDDNKTLSADSLFTLLKQADLHQTDIAKAVLSLPPGYLVYTHNERGLVTYLSARNADPAAPKNKRHYHLPEALAGDKQPYIVEGSKADAYILVEGQADALSLAQLGLNAVALGGVAASTLKEHKRLNICYVALDNDAAGIAKATDIALTIDPLLKVATWPQQLNGKAVKDANDLLKAGISKDDIYLLLENAPSAIYRLAQLAGKTKNEDRKALIERFFSIYTSLDDMIATDIKPELAQALCNNLSQFQRLLKAYKEKQNATGEDKDDNNPSRYDYSAGGYHAPTQTVWEQCILTDDRGESRVYFAVRTADGKITEKATLDIGRTCYIPYPANMGLVSAGVVLFPEKPIEYGTEKQLVAVIQDYIHTYLDVDPFYERLAAYYILFSWMYDLFENLPYLRALGDYGTGKTRFIMTIGALCYRPMFASGASTVSPIFNLIDMFRGTLVIDEADFSNSDSEAEIIKILNVGYYKKGVVLRSEKDPSSKDDKYWPSAKMVYGPKILATRKPFQDRATESRCLTRRMTTARPRPDIPFTLEDNFWAEAAQIRNKLLMYRLRNHKPLRIDQSLADTSVEPRLNQVTMALKTVIKDPEMQKGIDTFIRAYNETMISDRKMTLPAIIVQTLLDINSERATNLVGDDTRDFTMKGIAERAQSIINDIDPDQRITAKKVGQILTEDLGLPRRGEHPRTKRAIVIFEEEELAALALRYGIKL